MKGTFDVSEKQSAFAQHGVPNSTKHKMPYFPLPRSHLIGDGMCEREGQVAVKHLFVRNPSSRSSASGFQHTGAFLTVASRNDESNSEIGSRETFHLTPTRLSRGTYRLSV